MDKFCEFLEIRNFYQNYIFFQVIQRAITFAFFQLQRCSTTHWKAKKLYFSKTFDFLKIDQDLDLCFNNLFVSILLLHTVLLETLA